jgi:ribonuclease P protein component
VSVGKRNFKKAVDRNKIKRQLRVVLQKNTNKMPFSGVYMLIYNTGFFINTNVLVLELGLLLNKLKKNSL